MAAHEAIRAVADGGLRRADPARDPHRRLRHRAQPRAAGRPPPARGPGPSGELEAELPALAPQMQVAPVDAGPQAQQNFKLDKPLREARDEFEKAYFEYHLARESGSMTRVAEKTGLERTHLYRKLKQLGVDLTRGKRNGP